MIIGNMKIQTFHNNINEFVVDVESVEPTYLMINTSDYFSDENKSGIIIVSGADLDNYGWENVELEVGERLVSEDYGLSAQIIRLS